MRNSVHSAPGNLEGAFNSTLTRIDALSGAKREVAYRLLNWIAFAKRRLRVNEITQAFAIEEDNDKIDVDNYMSEEQLLRLSLGLVFIDGKTKMVGLIHASVYEYFQKRSLQVNVELDISKACLSVLSLRQFRQFECIDAQQMRARFADFPFLEYAAHFWGQHISACGLENETAAAVLEFLADANLRSNAFKALQFHSELMGDVADAHFSSIPTSQEALHITAYWNLASITRRILQGGVDPSPLDSQSWTPLHWTCVNGHLGTTEILIDHGASIDAQDSEGWSPLFWAAFYGRVDIVKFLLSHHANHLARSRLGWTALHWAMSRGNHEIVEILLSYHSTVDPLRRSRLGKVFGNRKGQGLPASSAAHHASNLYDALSRHSIVEQGNASYSRSRSWLKEKFNYPVASPWRTIMKGKRDELPSFESGLLCWRPFWELDGHPTKGASADTAWKAKLLLSAIKDGNLESAKVLIATGADVSFDFGTTALHAAAFQNDPQFCQELLRNGANTKAPDDNGFTALHHAVMNGYPGVTTALLSGGSNPDERVQSRERGRASREYNYNAALNLDRIARRFCREAFDPSLATPLILTCGLPLVNDSKIAITLDITITLLSSGADPSLQDRMGMGPLHYASLEPDRLLIEQLLDAGARVTVADNAGRTPVDLLAEYAPQKKITPVILDTLFKYTPEQDRLSLLLRAPSSVKKLQTDGGMSESNRETTMLKVFGARKVNGKAVNPVLQAARSGRWSAFGVLYMFAEGIRQSLAKKESIIGTSRDFQQSPAALRKEIGAGLPDAAIQHLVQSFLPSVLTSEDFVDFARALRSLLLAQRDINYEDPATGQSAILTAAQGIDSDQVMQALLRYSANPYLETASSFDAFISAAVHSRLTNLRFLVKYAIQHPPNNHWTSSLSSFSSGASNEYDLICSCLQHANLVERTKSDGKTMLHMAAETGNHQLVISLLSHGANTGAVDNPGFLPLHYAVFNRHYEVLKSLHPLAPDTLAADGQPVSHTPDGIDPKVFLVESDAKYKSKGTVLDASLIDHNTPILVHLLHLGADAEQPIQVCCGVKPQTRPLYFATERGYEDMVSTLLSFGVLVDARNSYGWTALHIAADRGYDHIAKILIHYGADISATALEFDGYSPGDKWPGQPLHLAVLNDHTSTIRLLLDAGANVNDSAGRHGPKYSYHCRPSALHMALAPVYRYSDMLDSERYPSTKTRVQIANLLIAAGADVKGVADHLNIKDAKEASGEVRILWERLKDGWTDNSGGLAGSGDD